jgi:AcrR family transcriptional regulator
MKREAHKAAVRGKIISVARKLFLAQGYQKTKMRQIKEAAGVEIGTIYHFYRSKDDIFEKIVLEAFFRVLERTSRFAEGNKLLHLACELSWHVHTMAQHAPSAELYLMSYNSPDIAAQLLVNQIERSRDIFGERFPEKASEDYKIYAMCARGLMQSISLQAVSGTLTEPDLTVRKCVQLLFKMMDTPPEETREVLEALNRLDIPKKVADVLG